MARPKTLRGRLALVFALATTVLSVGFGLALLHNARQELARAIDEGLVPVSADLVARVARDGPGVVALPPPSLAPPSDAIAQVLSSDGEVVARSPAPTTTALVTPEQLARALSGSVVGELTLPKRPEADPHDDTSPGGTERMRVLAVPARFGDQRYVVVVAAAADEAARLERELVLLISFGMPALAVALALGGWLLTGAMFRPVRAIIEQADRISASSASEVGARLSIDRGGAELVELGQRLDAMLDRIDSATDRERAFLDEASHELRTPIAIVRGELELARSQVGPDGPLPAMLDSTLEEVERLDRLAHNLLVLARSRSGRIGEDLGPVDLETVAHRAVRAVSRQAGTRAVTIEVTGTAIATGDELSLERAAVNLLDNAVRFARARVDVVVSQQDGWARLEVSDDGPGFDPAVLPVAFDRFRTGSGAGPGAGLGLAIVAAIVAALGGRVEAENRSASTEGAVVRLLLPAD
jgi:two-component system OmpR family sensor kinase